MLWCGLQKPDRGQLDLTDPDDALLGTLFAILFLTCYFADYPEHVNIWLVGKGEQPIDFGGSMSQTSGMAQQMNDLFGENAGSFSKQVDFSKLKDFTSTLDTTTKSSYTNNNTNSGPSFSGPSGVDIGELNPIRYRGYYWDCETEYYFLQTRYYSPEWRRFLNADSLFIAGDLLTATNMYAYCDGNPVMYVDPTGCFAKKMHFDLTREWAFAMFKEAGFSDKTAKSYANTIAWANFAMDILPSTSFYSIGNQSWHFNTNKGTNKKDSRKINSENSMAFAKNNLRSMTSALIAVGQGLHAVQDMVSHTDDVTTLKGGIYGHGKGVDDYVVGDAKYKAAKLATETYLKEFINALKKQS